MFLHFVLASASLGASLAAHGGQSISRPLEAPIAPEEKLRFVVIVTRHGVRSPTGKIDQLNQYSSQPWPTWTVPPGYLTEHGAKLMTLFGGFDRALLTKQGLLSPEGCADADRITILADSDQRTRETGKALAAGLMPGCNLVTQALPEGTHDPLFHPLLTEDGFAEKQIAAAALAGRIGNNSSGLAEVYRAQLQSLEQVLTGKDAPPKMSLFEIPPSIAPGKGDHLVDLKGPLSTAATMAENLLLEYTEGMPQVGWGRVDDHKLRELMQLHTANADLERRTPYIARAQAAVMLQKIADSMRQATLQKRVPGALCKPTDRLLVLVGHDTNLTNISGVLDLSWLIDGRRDDTPPGGALIFELWQDQSSSQYTVRLFFSAQSLDQMRSATPLTLENPPERVPIFLPACSRASMSCDWLGFESRIRVIAVPNPAR
jgi:4-phytase/acid phosphatase